MSTAVQNDSPVILTESAAEQIKTIQAGDAEKQGKAFRVFIEQGGCSGMQYGMDFDERRDGDFTREFHVVELVIDPISEDYMRGS